MDTTDIVKAIEAELNDQGRHKEPSAAFDEAMKLLMQAHKDGDTVAITQVNAQLHKDGFLSDSQIIAAKYDDKTQAGELVLRFKDRLFGIDEHGQPVGEHPEGPICQTQEQEKQQRLETYCGWAGAQLSHLDASSADKSASAWQNIVAAAPGHGKKEVPSQFASDDGKHQPAQIDTYYKGEDGVSYHEQYSVADGKGSPQLVMKQSAFETANKSRVLITEQPGAPPRASVTDANLQTGYEIALTDPSKLVDTIKELRALENK